MTEKKRRGRPKKTDKAVEQVEEAPATEEEAAGVAGNGQGPNEKTYIELTPEIIAQRQAKLDALANVAKDATKQFGARAMFNAADQSSFVSVPRIKTGILEFDLITGGGFPRSHIVELFGGEGGGKTSLALQLISAAQAVGGVAQFIDAEHALNPERATDCGVDLANLYITQPDYGEQGLSVLEMIAKANAADVVVIDSLAALIPKKMYDGEIGDVHVGLQARMMSQALARLKGMVANSQCCVIFINQIREKIGVTWGSPETTPGGRAMKFYADMRIKVTRVGQLKEGEHRYGHKAKIDIIKSKVSPSYISAEMDVIYGPPGVDTKRPTVERAAEHAVLKKKGAWFAVVDNDGNEISIGQGALQAIQWLDQNPQWREWVIKETQHRMFQAFEQKRKARAVSGISDWSLQI